MKKTKLKHIFLIFLISIVLISSLILTGIGSNIDLVISDSLQGNNAALDSIVIITIDDRSIQEVGRWPWDREIYAQILPKLKESKVIGMDIAFIEEQNENNDSILAEAIKNSGKVIIASEYIFENGKQLLKPIKILQNSAKDFGYVNVVTDMDGKTRSINPNIKKGESFSYKIYENYWNIPLELKDRFIINYAQRESFKTYSFIDVLNNKYSQEEFKDKIVLVGATASDLHDDVLAPGNSKPLPGVEVHANVINNLIQQEFLKTQSNSSAILAVMLISLIVCLIFYYFSIRTSILLSILMIILNAFLAIFSFEKGLILKIIYVPLTIVITYLALVIYFYIYEKKNKKKILGAFQKYVSTDVIKHILDNPEKLKLGGEKREITVFFSDIRGFTTISEKLTPEELVSLLNEYLTEMTNIILKYNGVVDKYMGDAIMAFWNAPFDQKNHAELAAKASIEMEEKLEELTKKWNMDFKIGIGLNTGNAVIGNMGSYDRFDYTAMGDNINLGARLESINKEYSTMIIISESTKKQLKNFLVRKLDKVIVKGKNKAIILYELINLEKDSKWHKDIIEGFEKGLELYFKQKWDEAIKEFKKVLKLRANDGPSKVFIKRCETFKQNPPEKDWNGVWTMKTK